MNWDAMRAELSRKVGPLPLGGWLAIAAVGVAAAIVIRRRLAAARAAAGGGPVVVGPDGEPLATAGADMLGVTGAYVPGGFVVGGAGGSSGTATGQAPTPDPDPYADVGAPELVTNDQWQSAAVRHLIAAGYQPDMVVDAIGRWLAGMDITTQQQAMLNVALVALGPPPIQPPPAPTTPPAVGGPTGGAPTTSQPSKPAATPTVIYRWNGGPDGPGSFVAVLRQGTTVTWIKDGHQYNALKAQHPENVVDAATFASVLRSSTRTGAKPRWLPPGAVW